MKRKEILVLIGEVLGSRAVYSVASLVITITMLSGITIILRNDIRDIKNYVQSVVDGDPNYKEIHSQVRGSENVIRGNIDLEALLAKEDKKTETTSTANNISSGYDNYTPTQTITDDISNRPSNNLNNSTTGETTVTDNNSNSNNSNNSTNEANNSNNNSDEDKKEDVLDRSSFNGKDVMVLEGEPFNPMNALQLAATDINGKNITSKIVIKENNVDTYKPGLYTVKATVELSDKSNLEKEFFVRVEPTVLNLAVNDIRTSKDVLEKSEGFNLSFAVKSSKSYLEVASVNINNKDYVVKKISSNSFFRKSNKYEVDLLAPSKSGVEKIEIKSVTMSDGTVIDVNKSIDIEILKEDANLTDTIIRNISNEDENIFFEYNLKDVDNVIDKAFLYLYDENDIIIQQEELEKNNKSSISLNINKNGNYKIQIKGYYKENLNYVSNFYSEKELFLENIEVKKISINKDEISLVNLDYNGYNSIMELEEKEDMIAKDSNATTIDEQMLYKNIQIRGSVANKEGELPVGDFNITVPTKVSFSITRNGVVNSAQIKVKNSGNQNIEVYAYSFTDKTGDEKINIVKSNEINNESKNSKVMLFLMGNNSNRAYLSSNGKIYMEEEHKNIANVEGVKLLELSNGTDENPQMGNILIDGIAGKIPEKEAISDEFVLTLKIKKGNSN